ncbi:hypothetical protein bwei_5331 [Bacillus mycoides]|nr:hypothetical protein bwei_5331 [Bacillus mycoides]GAE42719.1 hypothetical protein BW1_072_00260 [Bacillus mycoides NBRC 101238 = DSM 11821]
MPSTIAHGETLPSSVSTSIGSVNINEVSDETPVIDVYDKDGNLIKTYTKESSVAKFLGIKIDEEFSTNYYATIFFCIRHERFRFLSRYVKHEEDFEILRIWQSVALHGDDPVL